MAQYEKIVNLAGTDVKIIFHGVERDILTNGHAEPFKFYDDVYCDAGASHGQWHGKGKLECGLYSDLSKIGTCWGDIVIYSNNTAYWNIKSVNVGSLWYEWGLDIPYTFTPDSDSEYNYPLFRPFGNTNYGFDTLIKPIEINAHNIIYFETVEDYNDFKNTIKTTGVIKYELIKNLGADETQESYETSKQYYFKNDITTYLKDAQGKYSIKQGTTYHRCNFDATEKRLYFTGNSATNSNLVLKNYSGVSCQYSTDGKRWINAENMPTSLENVVKGNLKVGGAVLNGNFITNIPIFADNNKGIEYENENIGADEADNVDNLSKDDESPVTPSIQAGNSETQTTLGTTVSMDKMTMYYKLTPVQLANFGATLFNSENQDNVLAGTKLCGSDALNSIIGLRYYPFDISKVCGTTGTYYINLGSWSSGCASSGVITSNSGIIDMGSTVITPVFNNYLDYTNVGLSIYLPYIGMRSVDMKNVLKKKLSVKYVVDVTTGKCKAMLFADGLLFDTHDGVIARDCPVSGVDAQSYNTAIRQAGLNMTNTKLSGLNAITSVLSGNANIGGGYDKQGIFNTSPSVGVGINLGGISNAVNFASTYATNYAQATQDKVNAQNNMPTYFTGSSGGQLGELEPQYIYLMFTVNKTHAPADELELIGKPSNNSGTVSQFYGYLSCSISKMTTTATTAERNIILNLLQSGIYI